MLMNQVALDRERKIFYSKLLGISIGLFVVYETTEYIQVSFEEKGASHPVWKVVLIKRNNIKSGRFY